MRTITTLAVASLLTAMLGSGTALAQPEPGGQGGTKTGIGLGAEATLTGLAGATFLYDGGPWHVEVLAGFDDQDRANDPVFFLAGRFFWVLHSSNKADFSLGGGLGLLTDDNDTDIHIEGGGQIRVFVADNVAVSGTFGVGLVAGDNDRTSLGGQLIGGAGLAYYFY